MAVLVYKSLNGLTPDYHSSKFVDRSSVSSREFKKTTTATATATATAPVPVPGTATAAPTGLCKFVKNISTNI